MANNRYLTGADHAERLREALGAIHRALTRRWRQVVCDAIVAGNPDFPRWIVREASSSGNPLLAAVQTILPDAGVVEELIWDCWSQPARYHLELGYGCEYVWWVNGGQGGEVRAVSCHGSTYPDERGGAIGGSSVPAHIECGMGGILEQVGDWAYAECEHVFSQVPRFDMQDLGALEAAHNALIELGGQLGLVDAGADSEDGGRAALPALPTRDIVRAVDPIAGKHEDGMDWWAGWTGLAARAGSGFFASAGETVNNQSWMIGCLANLYSARATIITKGRDDALYWFKWAIESLDRTEPAPVDVTGWLVVQGIGMGTAAAFGWTAVGAVVGAAITLYGFVGQYIASTQTQDVYTHDMVEVIEHLNNKIGDLTIEIGGLEIGYSADVSRFREAIDGIHSYNLELYDLTQNEADGDRDQPREDGHIRSEASFSVNIDDVLRIAENSYKAGELYAGLLPIIAETRQADPHLADKDGRPTLADRRLLEVRDLFGGFLQTTGGRFLIAADQVRAAAIAYVDVDTSQAETLHDTLATWEDKSVGELAVDFDPEEYAAATDRPSWGPIREHPEAGGSSEPDTGDGDDYVVQSEDGVGTDG